MVHLLTFSEEENVENVKKMFALKQYSYWEVRIDGCQKQKLS